MENLVQTGKVEEQRARRRQRLTFLRWLEKTSGIQRTWRDCYSETAKKDRDVTTAAYVRILARHTERMNE